MQVLSDFWKTCRVRKPGCPGFVFGEGNILKKEEGYPVGMPEGTIRAHINTQSFPRTVLL